MQPYTSLHLDGKQYDETGLREFCRVELSKDTIASWQRDLYQFILEWIDPEKSSVEVHTSGSTGEPKLIELPKYKMVVSAKMTAQYLDLGKGTKALLCLSASYIAGKMMVVRAFVNQWQLITVEPTANPLYHFNIGNIDFTALVPLQLQNAMMESGENLSRVKKIIVGGAPVTKAIQDDLPNFPVAVYETFGMTETISHIAMRKISGNKPARYFEALEGVQLSLDKRGCLVIEAPVTDEAIVTNDMVELKDDKHFRWLGRYDNVVNSGGVKLFPEMLEAGIREHLNFRFFFAGMPDKVFGEKLVMVIESQPFDNKTMDALQLLLRSHLKKYERPRKILFVDEFEETPTGKVKRKENINKASAPSA